MNDETKLAIGYALGTPFSVVGLYATLVSHALNSIFRHHKPPSPRFAALAFYGTLYEIIREQRHTLELNRL